MTLIGLNNFLVVAAVILPILAGWRIWLMPDNQYRRYQTGLLLGIAVNNCLTVWSWADIVQAMLPRAYYAKRIAGLGIEDIALALLCLFLLDLLPRGKR